MIAASRPAWDMHTTQMAPPPLTLVLCHYKQFQKCSPPQGIILAAVTVKLAITVIGMLATTETVRLAITVIDILAATCFSDYFFLNEGTPRGVRKPGPKSLLAGI